MPTGTPFHPRTYPLCHSHAWRHWSGYVVATSYNDFVQPEYAAIRHAAALIDVSPLYKYSIAGPDAEALVDRVITHDAAKMPPAGSSTPRGATPTARSARKGRSSASASASSSSARPSRPTPG